ncbi:helix-turn-helix domain-containing protein [Bacillus velezensis]
MSLSKSLEAAETAARSRELEKESQEQWNSEDMQVANDLSEKAAKNGMKLVPDRKVKSRVRFAQMIQVNFAFLRSKKYLTTAEKNFIIDIMPNVGFLSNCLVDDILKKNPVPLTQTEIAAILGKKKQNVNPIINSLIDKGILARSESGLENNNVRAYAVYFNPHIVFCGDRDNVNDTLKTMFNKPMKKKVLKELPEKLW